MRNEAPPATGVEPLPVLTFVLGKQTYALPISHVVEVAAMMEMTTLVNTVPEVIGAVNRHGDVLPLLDLRRVMAVEAAEVDDNTLFVVAQNGVDDMVGLVVDQVIQVQYLRKSDVKTGDVSPNVSGMISHNTKLIQILDIESIIKMYLSTAGTGEGE